MTTSSRDQRCLGTATTSPRCMPDAEAAASWCDEAIDLLDRGEARVAEVVDGEVVVHQWLKQAILLCSGYAAWRPSSSAPSSTATGCR